MPSGAELAEAGDGHDRRRAIAVAGGVPSPSLAAEAGSISVAAHAAFDGVVLAATCAVAHLVLIDRGHDIAIVEEVRGIGTERSMNPDTLPLAHMLANPHHRG